VGNRVGNAVPAIIRPSSRGTLGRQWRFQTTSCLENDMTKTFACAAIAISLFVVSSPADATKGCIKGALVGGVAGHFAGHHGALGAAAGCVIGHHEANKPSKPQPSTTGSAPQSAPK